ncbi:hypothetical protein BGZ58_004011 [Dissophora ornata]|nr:hypothetical protein BGZ58_004011 [Dissophora ornata]
MAHTTPRQISRPAVIFLFALVLAVALLSVQVVHAAPVPVVENQSPPPHALAAAEDLPLYNENTPSIAVIVARVEKRSTTATTYGEDPIVKIIKIVKRATADTEDSQHDNTSASASIAIRSIITTEDSYDENTEASAALVKRAVDTEDPSTEDVTAEAPTLVAREATAEEEEPSDDVTDIPAPVINQVAADDEPCHDDAEASAAASFTVVKSATSTAAPRHRLYRRQLGGFRGGLPIVVGDYLDRWGIDDV